MAMDSTDESELVTCTASVYDSQAHVTETQLTAFAVRDIPAGQVRNSVLFIFTNLKN